MRLDINETLLRHIGTGGGAAYLLREKVKEVDRNFIDHIVDLFSARSDIRRITRAQDVARPILSSEDFVDIMLLRDTVAKQEQKRLINYAKQQDHTAHTVYLYLLGIWFFDHVTALREAVLKRIGPNTKEEDACEWFLFQWLFASLLHDIGYAFYDLSAETIDDRKKIDRIYQWSWLEELLGPKKKGGREVKQLSKLKEVHESWHTKYFTKTPIQTAATNIQPRAVLESLAAAPWLADFNNDKWKGKKSIFEVLHIGGKPDLEPYAIEVAYHGYGGNSVGCVDHAVASGLLLFQYVSYWYWLIDQLRQQPDKAAYNDAIGTFQYDLVDLYIKIVDACSAVAYHNVLPHITGSGNIRARATLQAEPILHLAILCDELQRWDRYAAGDELTSDYEKTAMTSLEGGDIELICAGTDEKTAIFRVTDNEVVGKLNETLNNRLEGYENIVKIEALHR